MSVWDQAIWNRSNDREGSAGRYSDGQAEMREDRGNYGRMFDGGDDLQGAAATQGHCSMSIANTRLSHRAKASCGQARVAVAHHRVPLRCHLSTTLTAGAAPWGRLSTLQAWYGATAIPHLLSVHRAQPRSANLTDSPADYRWSSYPCNALGQLDPLD